MRRTEQAQRVAAVLLADPDAHHWGYDTAKKARVRSGVLYPILRRFYDAGWLADGWEDTDTATTGRPARRYYTVTIAGRTAMTQLVNEPAGS